MLVVGATRILRPAVDQLVGRGAIVTAVARSRPDLIALARDHPGRVQAVDVDFGDVDRLRAALTAQPAFDAALVYAPQATRAALDVLRSVTDGPVVELVTSASAAPGLDDPLATSPPDGPGVAPGATWSRVLLGWRPDRTWHSPSEISAAALRALDEGRDLTLGAVRPWSDRPPGPS